MTKSALTYTLSLCAALWLAGCASGPQSGAGRDGAPPKSQAGSASQPDAVPRVEPIRRGGPNKPYEVLGQSYQPLTDDVSWRETGMASWYGAKFHGRRTASGEVYSMYGLSAAHRTLPIPSYAQVRHVKTGKKVVVRINDRGPFHASRVIDLSHAAAAKLGIVSAGTAEVEITRLTFDDIQRGAWESSEATPKDDDDAAKVSPDEGASNVIATAEKPSKVPKPSKAFTPAQRGFYVQLASLRQRDAVERLQRRVAAKLSALMPMLSVFHESSVYKLKVGPYASRHAARKAAAQAREALQLSPLVVERR